MLPSFLVLPELPVPDVFDFRLNMIHKARATPMRVRPPNDAPTMVPIATGPVCDRWRPATPDTSVAVDDEGREERSVEGVSR